MVQSNYGLAYVRIKTIFRDPALKESGDKGPTDKGAIPCHQQKQKKDNTMFNDAEDGFDATQETQPQTQTQPHMQSSSQGADVDSTEYWGILDPRSQDAPLFRLEHGKHTYIIGRGAKCDIQLKGVHISKERPQNASIHASLKNNSRSNTNI